MTHHSFCATQCVLALFAFLLIFSALQNSNSVHASLTNTSKLGNYNMTSTDTIKTTKSIGQNNSDYPFKAAADNKTLSASEYDKIKNCTSDTDKRPTSIEYLTFFNCGHVNSYSNNSNSKPNETITTREFTLFIDENSSIPIASNGLVFSPAWTFNGTIPGPTMRVTEGDMVKINVINPSQNNRTHSLHMHSIHPGDMDGLLDLAVYKTWTKLYVCFQSWSYRVYPYHCHSTPIDQHINKGLYGTCVMNPKTPRQNMS
ncbi:MAG: multicopper oxidase domain-containing protein [Candidatus Nitrosocosmicus sp.]|nr:multicopper oxidase domain-containing protein [Candidatus Nitrosocosmicus sp.]